MNKLLLRPQIKLDRADAETYGDYISCRLSLKLRVKRLGKEFGIGMKRICDEAHVAYFSTCLFLNKDRHMQCNTYDRLNKVVCHYEFLLKLNVEAEKERWRRKKKRKRKKPRKVVDETAADR